MLVALIQYDQHMRTSTKVSEQSGQHFLSRFACLLSLNGIKYPRGRLFENNDVCRKFSHFSNKKYRVYSNFLLNMAFISPSEVENIYIS